jgi:hypothetical protein
MWHMWRQSIVVRALLASFAQAKPNTLQEIDLPRDTSHPERDARGAIEEKDFGFIGVYSYAYTIPEVEGVYLYHRFSKDIHSRLKAVRGTSDIHRNDPTDINERAWVYAKRYNRVLLEWFERHHPEWLGPRQPLTH